MWWVNDNPTKAMYLPKSVEQSNSQKDYNGKLSLNIKAPSFLKIWALFFPPVFIFFQKVSLLGLVGGGILFQKQIFFWWGNIL
jgi:hypothetical protein